MVALKLLGGAHLVGAGGPRAGQACQRHRIALLALLRAAPNATLPRERLMALLWPEHPDHRARRLLNLSVHVLRCALRGALAIFVMFAVACLGWVFFRGQSLSECMYILSHLASSEGQSQVLRPDVVDAGILWLLVLGLYFAEYLYLYRPAWTALNACPFSTRLTLYLMNMGSSTSRSFTVDPCVPADE